MFHRVLILCLSPEALRWQAFKILVFPASGMHVKNTNFLDITMRLC